MSIQKMSKALSASRGCVPAFPIHGVDGYGGEQDGDTVSLSELYHADTLADADDAYPNPFPSAIRIHWSTYSPSIGWRWVFGVWDSECPDDWKWPA